MAKEPNRQNSKNHISGRSQNFHDMKTLGEIAYESFIEGCIDEEAIPDGFDVSITFGQLDEVVRDIWESVADDVVQEGKRREQVG